jgi:threonine aldolase
MRQAGILAACGLISLTKMVDRLAEDHARAKKLAESIRGLPGIRVDMKAVQTNMVFAEYEYPAILWQEELRDLGVLASPYGPHRMRFVLHADVDDAKLDRAIQAIGWIAKRQAMKA